MYRYGERVKIKSGFYKGCQGILVEYEKTQTTNDIYTVEINHIDANNCSRRTEIKVSERDLEIMERKDNT